MRTGKENLKIEKRITGIKKTSEKSEALIVIPLGLEPRAHTLKVYCSTN